MKFKSFIYLFITGAFFTMIFTLNSCSKDEVFAVPTVSLTATTYTGKIGTTATTTATVTAPGGFKDLKITKYNGTDVDATFGTAGTLTVTTASHKHDYVLTAAGLTTPVRFKFEATDAKGQKRKC